MADRFLTRFQVEALCGMTRSHIYRLMAESDFPRAIKFGRTSQQGAVRWSENEILQWIRSQPRYQPTGKTA